MQIIIFMNILKIKIRNFKSIYDEVELDFTNIRGFWKISGSVGSGKTTLGEAILFSTFGSINGKNNADLVSWGEKKGFIEVTLECRGKNIFIRRELKLQGQSELYVEIDGEELVATNKRDLQKQLEEEYYDISRTTMEMLCIISFNNFRSLSNMNTKDLNIFLDRVLGFYIISQYIDLCKNFKRDAHNEVMCVQNNINNIRSQINKIRELSNISKIQGNIHDTELKINQLNNYLKTLDERYRDKLSKNSKDIGDVKDKLNDLVRLGKSVSKEIELIERGICPTCGATIDDANLNDKKKEKELLLESYKENNKLLEGYKQEEKEITNAYKSVVDEKSKELKEYEYLKIKLIEQQNRREIDELEIVNLLQEIDKLSGNLSDKQIEENEWNELLSVLSNDTKQHILSVFIPVLNQNILKYINKLGQNYIIQFDQTFKCQVKFYDRDEAIPVSSLSTGQLKMVDMIIILGVLDTLFKNAHTNIIFLDELFSNLDNNLRNTVCNVLKETINPLNTMFIVSHQDIDESYFDGELQLNLELDEKQRRRTIINII